MAPEQRQGKDTDERSDIYCFGATLHEVFTGKPASLGLRAIEPPELDRAIKRCLEEDPDKRWQSAADLAFELRSIRDHRPAAAKTARPWGWIVSAALLVACLVLIWRQSKRYHGKRPAPVNVGG
jgi:serine/threonine protein kinase